MKNKLIGFLAGGTALAALLAFAPAASAASTLFGDASTGPGYIILPSDTTMANGFSGITFDDANGTTFGSLATLSTDYNVTDDNCGGGSPRVSVGIDTNNDAVADGFVHIAIGPSPSFTGCASGWQSTGNLIGNNDAGRYDFSQFGGSPFTTYSNAPAAVVNGKVTEIDIVVDGSWSAAATGGDSEQTIWVDNTNINGTTYNFEPPTFTVTIDKYLDGSMATPASANSASFPMVSTWVTTNFPSGSGSYALAPGGFNSGGVDYEAVTSQMNSGANYTTNEVTGGTSNVGNSCADGKPYALQGYSTGTSPSAAASAPVTATVPAFTNITQNQYVVVHNVSCGTLTVTKTATGGNRTFNFTGDNGMGSFSITTVGGTGNRVLMVPNGTYHITESVPSGWTQTSNGCSTVVVTSAGASCTIANQKNGTITITNNNSGNVTTITTSSSNSGGNGAGSGNGGNGGNANAKKGKGGAGGAGGSTSITSGNATSNAGSITIVNTNVTKIKKGH